MRSERTSDYGMLEQTHLVELQTIRHSHRCDNFFLSFLKLRHVMESEKKDIASRTKNLSVIVFLSDWTEIEGRGPKEHLVRACTAPGRATGAREGRRGRPL